MRAGFVSSLLYAPLYPTQPQTYMYLINIFESVNGMTYQYLKLVNTQLDFFNLILLWYNG